MAATEELRVVIKTEADTSGAKQASDAIEGVSRKARGGAADVAADLTQQQIRAAGGLDASLRQQQAGAAALATRVATTTAGPPSLSAQNVRQLALAFVGFSTVGAIAHQVISQIAQSMGDAVQAFREYQRAVPYASTATTNLDTAFNAAKRSGDRLEITLGRLAAPSVTSGLKAQASAFDAIADALNRFPSWVEEQNKQPAPFAKGIPGLSNEAPFAPAAPEVAAAAAEIRKTTEDFARQQARLRQLNDLSFTAGQATAAADQARVDRWVQIDAAATALTDAQKAQTALQQHSVDLAAQEAQIRLSMLPAAERLAEAQRQITEQQIRASIAALPANEALDNARAAAEHARLIVQDFSQPLERRQAALRESINLQMRTLPGLELGAFEANEPVRLAGQAGTRVGLEARLFEVSTERQLAQITLAQETNQLLSAIADQRTQAIQLTINLSPDQFRNDVYSELIDANARSQTPPATQSSAVRRSGPS